MKKKSAVSLGPGASSLILIFVVLALSVLGMLTLMNSRDDLSLSQRSAQVAEASARLAAKTEEKWAALDAIFAQAASGAADDAAYLAAVAEALPEDVALWDREIYWLELDSWQGVNGGLRQIDCALALNPLGDTPRAQWARHALSAVTDEAVKALNKRAERKFLALEEALSQARQGAADEAHYLAAAQSALPEGMTLSDGVVSYVETNAGTETDSLLALHCQAVLLPLDSEETCAWKQRSVTSVEDADDLAVIRQADATLQSLAQSLAEPLRTVYSAEWKSTQEAETAFLRMVAENLPDYASLQEREISWTEANENRLLFCAVELQPLGSGILAVWTSHSLLRLDAAP